ncbi:ATP dependent RNA helicase YTHDC2 [Echinococcus multilocularis]|uniref:ATP dependent RNA helicase YTHDC2 n=1 Tax=Echinococcus multilocularis TaxID=6211 RepID=A0A068YCZ7_ECHMU|nr:ATP dependent RNA helicase YTHDC2 [Echinococcus multilocularis]
MKNPPLQNTGEHAPLILSRNCRNIIKNLLQTNPLLVKELEVLAPNYERNCELGSREERQRCMTGRLMGAVPQVPSGPFASIQKRSNPAVDLAKKASLLQLPIRKDKTRLLRLVNENRIVIVAGRQGCGKSTQIPQILLEDCHAHSQRCRIICTQPRRLSAHANADRVAYERSETVGQSIGYQIRLESKVSPKTVLTFCTYGVLLRTIFADPTLLNATTHILVDELDEEDLFSRKLTPDGREVRLPVTRDISKHTCNLLLGTLHRILAQYSHLRLVLIVNLKSASYILSNGHYLQFPANSKKCNQTEACIDMKEPILQTQLPLFLEKTTKRSYLTTNFLLASQYRSASMYCLKTEQKSNEIFFLEDVLQWLNFNTPEMETAKRIIRRDSARVYKMYFWLTGTSECPLTLRGFHEFSTPDNEQLMESADVLASTAYLNVENLIWILWENLVLRSVYYNINKECQSKMEVQPLISDLLQSISVEWIPVDYKHSETAAGHLEVVERLLNLGADVFERVPLPRAAMPPGLVTLGTDRAAPTHYSVHHLSMIGANAFDLARLYGHARVADLLKAHMAARSLDHPMDDWEGNLLRFGCWFANPMLRLPSLLQPARSSTLERSYNNWVERHFSGLQKHRFYQVARNWVGSGSTVDFELLAQLIFKVDSALAPAIITLKEYLTASSSMTKELRRQRWIFVLHSRMLVADLKQIFMQPPSDIRKIILATDIAESSVAISDIAYVIDTGLVKKKEEDPNTGALISQNRWISYNSAIQRQYAAQMGREPKCFHLYSRLRLTSLETTVDEPRSPIVRHTMEEVCLHAKLLSPPGENLNACFQSLPHVLDPIALDQSIRSLRIIDAVDASGDLTELGSHMCDLPLPPRYSKMVLVSIALKCVDPILTIACILANENPFTLPSSAKERKEAQIVRKKFSADSLSDHMVLLRAFQFWQKARFEGWEQSFCRKNYISAAVFDIVTTVRTQLLGQLRASGFVKARGSGDIRDLNTHSENWAVVKAALVAGMYDNLAQVDSESGNLVVSGSSLNASKEILSKTPYWVRPSPLSVLATNLTDSSPVDLKQLPSHWLVYDKLIGQCSVRELNRHRGNSDTKGNCGKAKKFKCRENTCKEPERKLLHCVTVVSPFTTALVAGPVRSPIICTPTEDINSDFRQPGYEFLRNRTRFQQNQPLTMADIERILKNFNTEVPRLEALGLHQSEDSVMKIQEAMLVEHQSVKEKTQPKRTVVLRLDGPDGILAYECELEVARLISDLRQKWNSLLLRRLRNPGKPSQQQDEALLSTIVAVLSAEEQVLGLRQPTGVGARPRPMATELCNQNDTVTDAATSGSSVTGPLPSPAAADEDGGGDSNSEGAPVESPTTPVAAVQLPQTLKQPTRLSSNTLATNQQANDWASTFGGGDDGSDTNKRKHPRDASCTASRRGRPRMWDDSLTDNLAQLKLANSQSPISDHSATYFKFERAQTHQRMCQQQNHRSQQCCDLSLALQVNGNGGDTYPSEADARPLATPGTYADKSNTDNFHLTNPSITFGSLQPLGQRHLK